MNYFVVAIISFAAGILFSPVFDPVSKIHEILYSGTIEGLEACMQTKRNSFLSDEQTKKICIDRQETKLPSTYSINGRSNVLAFGIRGTIENGLSDTVVTEITVRAFAFDSDGEETSLNAVADVWIIPNESENYDVNYTSSSKFASSELEWCSERPHGQNRLSCKSWTLIAAKGIKL